MDLIQSLCLRSAVKEPRIQRFELSGASISLPEESLLNTLMISKDNCLLNFEARSTLLQSHSQRGHLPGRSATVSVEEQPS